MNCHQPCQHRLERRHKYFCEVITRRLYSLVVVRIHTNFIFLEVECILASVNGPKLMVAVKVGPSPQAAVDDMRQSFTMRNLKTAIQRPNAMRGKNADSSVIYSEDWRTTVNIPKGVCAVLSYTLVVFIRLKFNEEAELLTFYPIKKRGLHQSKIPDSLASCT